MSYNYALDIHTCWKDSPSCLCIKVQEYTNVIVTVSGLTQFQFLFCVHVA